jgi:hypothetical protein
VTATVGGRPCCRRRRRCCSQNGYLSSRGGCPNRWHSLVNCDHGDSTSSRFDSPERELREAGQPVLLGGQQLDARQAPQPAQRALRDPSPPQTAVFYASIQHEPEGRTQRTEGKGGGQLAAKRTRSW